jgi:hypothetical protein
VETIAQSATAKNALTMIIIGTATICRSTWHSPEAQMAGRHLPRAVCGAVVIECRT